MDTAESARVLGGSARLNSRRPAGAFSRFEGISRIVTSGSTDILQTDGIMQGTPRIDRGKSALPLPVVTRATASGFSRLGYR
jgi:hypothetical protein